MPQCSRIFGTVLIHYILTSVVRDGALATFLSTTLFALLDVNYQITFYGACDLKIFVVQQVIY